MYPSDIPSTTKTGVLPLTSPSSLLLQHTYRQLQDDGELADDELSLSSFDSGEGRRGGAGKKRASSPSRHIGTSQNIGHKRMSLVVDSLHTGLSPKFEAFRFFPTSPPTTLGQHPVNHWSFANATATTTTTNGTPPSSTITSPWIMPGAGSSDGVSDNSGTFNARSSHSTVFFLDDDGIETFGDDDESKLRSDSVVEIQSAFASRIYNAAMTQGLLPSHVSVAEVLDQAAHFTRLVERRAWRETQTKDNYVFCIHRISQRIAMCSDEQISAILHSEDHGMFMLTQ